MKRLRRYILALATIVLAVSIILLLNITAPNPTGRRYSSQMPLTTGQADGQAIGSSAELILSTDLRLPNNNEADQRQCFCKNQVANGKECNVCFPVNDLQSDYRIPDFIAPNFIAESKNARNLLYTGREFDQISDYAVAAKVLKKPLWVYIRVNTYVDPDFYQIVTETGGGVVPYFSVPGYSDPVDDAAGKSGLVSGVLVIGGFWLEWRGLRGRTFRIRLSPPVPKPPRKPDPLTGTVRKVTQAEDFTMSAKDRVRAKMDEEDEWNDL